MKIDNFFAELKRRNIYKVAVAYAVVAWLLVQVTTQVFPIFEIPNWALRLIVLAIIVGFPIALVMAWAFELTPEGLKRTEDVDPFDSRSGQILAAQTRAKSHAWIFVVIIAGAMSLGLFFLGRFTAPRKQGGANEVSSKSIAVLPFVNLSSDKEQEFFSDGLSEELLNQLAQVPQLRVIARTSSFSFKGKEVELNRRSRWPRTWLWATAVADTFAILAPGIGKVRQRISNELWPLDPNNAELLSSYSESLFFGGRQTEAVAMARKATVIDPLSVDRWQNLALLLFCSGQEAEARLAWQHALDIYPGARWPNYLVGYLDLKEGKIEDARAHFRATDEPFRLTGTAMVEHMLGHAPESEQALDTLKTKYTAGSAFQIAAVYAWRGEKDRAFEWLDRAYDQHDAGMPRLRYDPTLATLHDDSRFAALVKKMGFLE